MQPSACKLDKHERRACSCITESQISVSFIHISNGNIKKSLLKQLQVLSQVPRREFRRAMSGINGSRRWEEELMWSRWTGRPVYLLGTHDNIDIYFSWGTSQPRKSLANEIARRHDANEERKGKESERVPFKFIPARRKRRNLLVRSLACLLCLSGKIFLALRHLPLHKYSQPLLLLIKSHLCCSRIRFGGSGEERDSPLRVYRATPRDTSVREIYPHDKLIRSNAVQLSKLRLLYRRRLTRFIWSLSGIAMLLSNIAVTRTLRLVGTEMESSVFATN